jgi:predicted membrane protein
VLLTLAVVKGLVEEGSVLFDSARLHNDTASLILAIDRMLLVLMIVEILHIVGVSFRSHTLTEREDQHAPYRGDEADQVTDSTLINH